MTEDHDKALAWLQNNTPGLNAHEFEPGDVIVNIYKLQTLLEKIHEIRNSIVGLATFNWSEHMYPLVAALGEIGLDAEGYDISRPRFSTMLKRTVKAEKQVEELKGLLHGVERAATFLLDHVTTMAEEDLDDEKFWKPMREARLALQAPGPDLDETRGCTHPNATSTWSATQQSTEHFTCPDCGKKWSD